MPLILLILLIARHGRGAVEGAGRPAGARRGEAGGVPREGRGAPGGPPADLCTIS